MIIKMICKSKFHLKKAQIDGIKSIRKMENLIKPCEIKLLKFLSIFQIIYYNIQSRRERTLLLITNATEIYER